MSCDVISMIGGGVCHRGGSVMKNSKLTTFTSLLGKSLTNLHETQSNYSVNNSYLIPSQFGASQSVKIHEIKKI